MTSPNTRGPGSDDAPQAEERPPVANTTKRRIVVAGGGIGGLTAALALERAGFSVHVLERSERLGEVGAGIQMSPNAWRVLDSLGAIPALEAAMVHPEAVHIGSVRAGGIVGRIPFGETARQRYGAPYSVIHRGDLHQGLAETARERPGIEIHLGMAVADAQEDEDGITVEIQGPEGVSSYRAEALIAADGVWSTVRRRLLRLPSADYSGRVAYRATFSAEKAPDLAGFTGLWMGEKAHLVHYPISGGREINVVAIVESSWQEETWSAPVERDEVLRQFEGWPAEPRRLLTTPGSWLKWALCDIGPRRHLGGGTHRAAGRRRPRHAALHGAGRSDGDRGCPRGRAMPRQRPGRGTRRCWPTSAPARTAWSA